MSRAEGLERRAQETFQRTGNWQASRGDFLEAVSVYLDEGGPSADWAACRLLGEVALLDRAAGNLEGASWAANHFVTLAMRPQKRWQAPARTSPGDARALEGAAWMNCALVFDDTGDPNAARALWLRASAFSPPGALLEAFCRAHAAGCSLALRQPTANAEIRAVLSRLDLSASPSVFAGLLGAVGQSAGAREVGDPEGAVGQSAGALGVPYLAQAAWLMWFRLSALNPSTAPFLAALCQRLGFQDELVPPLVCLLYIATFHGSSPTGGPPQEVPALRVELEQLIARCAGARRITTQAFLAQLQTSVPRTNTLGAELERLVPAATWLVPVPRGTPRQ